MENSTIIKDVLTNGYVQLVLTVIVVYLAAITFRRS